MSGSQAPVWQKPLVVVAWLVSALGTLADLVIWLNVGKDVLTLIGTRQPTHAAELTFARIAEVAEWVMWFIVVVAGVALSVWYEYHYRLGLGKGVFLKRWLDVTVILVAGAGLGLVLQALI